MRRSRTSEADVSAFQQMLLAGPGEPSDPLFANVSLLLFGDGANNGTIFTDSSSYNRTLTRVGNTVTSTAQKKFASASIYIPTGSDSLIVPSNSLTVYQQPFTLEFWIYIPVLPNALKFFMLTAWPSTYMSLSPGNVISLVSTTSVDAGVVTAGEWNYFAWSSDAGNAWGFNSGGVYDSSALGFTQGTIPSTFEIGGTQISSSGFRLEDYYISNLRFTSGVTRYTPGNFPGAPTARFPDQ
jgi:hypothetical protein